MACHATIRLSDEITGWARFSLATGSWMTQQELMKRYGKPCGGKSLRRESRGGPGFPLATGRWITQQEVMLRGVDGNGRKQLHARWRGGALAGLACGKEVVVVSLGGERS
jgi:hypothetical protein